MEERDCFAARRCFTRTSTGTSSGSCSAESALRGDVGRERGSGEVLVLDEVDILNDDGIGPVAYNIHE